MTGKTLTGYDYRLQYGRRACPFNWRLCVAFAANVFVWGSAASWLWRAL